MKIKSNLTPYPILFQDNEDYIESSFSFDIRSEIKGATLNISASLDLRDPALEGLISDGKAVYAVHYESPWTSLRRCNTSTGKNFCFELAASEIGPRIEMCAFIISIDTIASFYNPRFHPDYMGSNFQIHKGNILAMTRHRELDIILDNPMSKKSSSIFQIEDSKNEKGAEIRIDTADDRILISLRPDVYREIVKSCVQKM